MATTSALGGPQTGSGTEAAGAAEAAEAAEAGDRVGHTPHVGHGGAVVILGLTLKNPIFFGARPPV